jgi:hypothetical protein
MPTLIWLAGNSFRMRGSHMGRRRGFLVGVLLMGIVVAICVYFSRQLLYLSN